MNRRRKIILSLGLILILLLISGFFMHQSVASWRWSKAASAAGGLPYQIGLTNAIVIPCFTSCCAPACTCCAGGTLCMTKDVGTCTLYSDVSGMPAGGMGREALFTKIAIGQAGLNSGGQLIAGGMSMTQMDQGVLASSGGCYGCGLAKAGTVDKIYSWLEKLDKFIIAGFKSK
jgi:hypothetical protein